jgi:hypothetical protein
MGMMVQGAVISSNAADGTFTLTDAHEIQFQ